MHHIFASGEFTVKTPAMESRIPEAVFAVGEQDATAFECSRWSNNYCESR